LPIRLDRVIAIRSISWVCMKHYSISVQHAAPMRCYDPAAGVSTPDGKQVSSVRLHQRCDDVPLPSATSINVDQPGTSSLLPASTVNPSFSASLANAKISVIICFLKRCSSSSTVGTALVAEEPNKENPVFLPFRWRLNSSSVFLTDTKIDV
jgi:hypothetical protein